ncbi:hypothetical protein [Brevibacillus laterosporus]|uniref:hypothetical protein n=1 Tax=Brevibacillus laterosporus TaxID=1465 RepID=UPI0026556612|nr:hypothetical protein [Brevibacillus laterosporus]MDN9010016.1 hypothetical protein [Brevibacillus laterosporus]MDO0940602.1 hypothetical protein [Brevibacillus laterosporus]
MTKRKLPPAKAWREREIADWNTTTFTEYLRDQHEELYRLPYVPARGWRSEQGMIKRMIDEHGTEVVKRFIDGCFRDYKPTRQYLTLTFTFMYTYMRARVLAKVLREERRVATKENVMSTEELAEWL